MHSSNVVKTVAPANCASICSTAGSGYLSLQTLRLSFIKLMQILDLGTTTIPEHHSVGS